MDSVKILTKLSNQIVITQYSWSN